MEGHAAVVLDDHYIVVIGGWGPDSNNGHILISNRI